MFRFSIRELMLVTLVAASAAGCKSRSSVAPRPTAAPTAKVPAVPQQITKEQAIAIVREDMSKNPEVEFDCKATEDQDEFRVFVDIGSGRDENGQLTGRFPGSHCTYVVSKQGNITKIHGGL